MTTPIRLGTAISMRLRNIISMNAIPYVSAIPYVAAYSHWVATAGPKRHKVLASLVRPSAPRTERFPGADSCGPHRHDELFYPPTPWQMPDSPAAGGTNTGNQ